MKKSYLFGSILVGTLFLSGVAFSQATSTPVTYAAASVKAVAAISGEIVNPQTYYKSGESVDYQLKIKPTREQPLLKGDTITLDFGGDSAPFTKIIVSSEFFESQVNEAKNQLVLTATKDVKYDATDAFTVDVNILPTLVTENTDPRIGKYTFDVHYQSGDAVTALTSQAYQVKNDKYNPWTGLAASTYAASVWGIQTSTKYHENYISGGMGKDAGLYLYTEPVQSFSGGIINGLATGNDLTDASLTVKTSNPIDPETLTVWDGVQGKLVPDTAAYQVVYADDHKQLTITGGNLHDVSGGRQVVAYSFSVVTPQDNSAQTTITQHTTGNLNGAAMNFKDSTNTAVYQKVDNGKFLPYLVSKDFSGDQQAADTTKVVQDPTTLVTAAEDYLDGTYTKAAIDYTINASDQETETSNDETLAAQLKKQEPGVYYVHFKVTNSSGNEAVAVSRILINMVTGQPVTVRYLNQENQEIAEAKVVSGNIDEAYDVSTKEYQKTIEGYTLDTTNLPENSKGTFTDEPQTVRYRYTKKPVAEGHVVVRYVDEDGQVIHAAKTISGKIGAQFDLTGTQYQLTLSGYQLREDLLPSSLTGTFTDKQQTYTFVYSQKAQPDSSTSSSTTTTTSAAESTEPQKSENTQSSEKEVVQYAEKKTQKLPQTAEQKYGITLLVGIVFLGFSGLLLSKKSRQK